jgi:hypothetical protein
MSKVDKAKEGSVDLDRDSSPLPIRKEKTES